MRAALVAVMVLVSACAGGAADETSTPSTVPVEPPPTTTTTVQETTTTTEAVGPVDICRSGRANLWKPGQDYVAGCFLVSVAFAPIDAGWRTSRVESDRFLVTFAETGEPVAEVAFLGYRPSSGLEIVVDSILRLEGLTLVSDQTAVTVGGSSAVTFDVETGLDTRPSAANSDECESNSLGTSLSTNGPGWRLLRGAIEQYNEFGFAPCRTFRVWVVDVADVAITMIATADKEPILRGAMPTIERLIDSMTFRAP